jgi:hypothetical protein
MIVAERSFMAAAGAVRLQVLAPIPDEGDWRCDFKIAWAGRESSGYAMGVDAVQALFLALQKAHIELLTSAEGRRDELRWLEMEDLGLPLPPGMTAAMVKAG